MCALPIGNVQRGDRKDVALDDRLFARGTEGGLGVGHVAHVPEVDEPQPGGPRNFTRFVVISRLEFLEGPRNKSSLIFSVGDTPGSLCAVLKIFADNRINLVNLESRPIHSKPWEYLFYADVEVDLQDEQFRPLLEELQGKTEYLKILGSYRKASEVAG